MYMDNQIIGKLHKLQIVGKDYVLGFKRNNTIDE